MKKIIFSALMLMSWFAVANTESYIGYWSVNCGGFGGNINISKNNAATVNINDNNLLIEAKLIGTNSSSTQLFFVDVLESRNDIIDWDAIPLQKPIASLFINNNELDVKWFGFFDKKLKKYTWDMQPDFVVATKKGKDITMHKCRFKSSPEI